MSRPATSSGFRLEACRQLLVADGRAEVGEQAQVLAQAQDGLLGAQRALELVVLPVADGAEQDGVGLLGQLERGFGQRMAVRLVGGAADRRGFQSRTSGPGRSAPSRPRPRFRCRCRHPAGLRSSFVCLSVQARLRCASQGLVARRSASKALILSAWRSVRPMSSKPLSRQYLRKGCTSNGDLAAVGLDDHLALQVDGQLRSRGRPAPRRTACATVASGSTIGSRPFLKQLLKKMSAIAGRDQRAEAVLLQRPGRVLAAGAAAEVLARQQDRGAR